MKKRYFAILAIVFGVFCFVSLQTTESKKQESPEKKSRVFKELRPQKVKVVAFGVSPKVSSFAPASPEFGEKSKKFGKSENVREIENGVPFRKQVENTPVDSENALAQIGSQPMPTPSLSFDGLSSNDNAAAYGTRVLPPDTIGDVGLNHYVQAINLLFRVYDKDGNPQTPPLKMSSLFKPLGTPCAIRNDGDPIVLYDSLADRWILSQFCKNVPPYRQMVAVSKTSDPTGEYYLYEFVMPNIKLNDYSKIGVWHDGYYMSTDEFFGADYAGSGVFAFEREKMLVGDPTASYVYFDLASPTTMRIGGLLPTDLDGLRPPPADSPNVFVGYTATEYGEAEDALRLFEFTVDYENPENSSFAEVFESPVAVAPFDPTSTVGRDDIEQPDPGEDLDSQSDRLMYRVAYQNFGDTESLVVNQTVRVSPLGQTYRAGVRVYELKRSVGGGSNEYAVSEQATIGDLTTSRFMAAVAQDHEGSIAVGYTTSNEKKEPSIVYTGKRANEQTGTFRNEAELVAGTGVQKAFGFRWGDYSGMSVDPFDGCSFWITNEYYTLQSQNESDFGWLTRVGKFKFNECVDNNPSRIIGSVVNSTNNQPIAGAIVDANELYSRQTAEDGTFQDLYVVSGTYNLTASAKGFRSKTINQIITKGDVENVVFDLEPIAVLQNEETSIVAESCAVNNTVEPSETVTLNIPLRNAGAKNTTNLTATLQAINGVTNPSKPQNYGALSTDGEIVSRPFTFTASQNLDCGEELILTFQLNDGSENLGTVEIPLQTGRLNTTFTENFDSVASPDLPSGWTTSFEGTRENWTTSTERAESLPNAAFSPDPRTIGVNQIVSPVIPIASQTAELKFRNWYELETTFLRNRVYDGAVLEIKIGGNDWEDILDAGGTFLSGGYNDGLIDSCCSNPLMGRRAWSGRSGVNPTPEFIDSVVKLPTNAAGNNVQFRWRVATDNGTFREGQYIDDVQVTDGFVCDCVVNTPASSAPFDFDGDGMTDLGIFRPSDSADVSDFYVKTSRNNANREVAWGSSGDVAVSSDYDGDGITDYAVFRPSSKTWFILNSIDNSFTAVNFGLADDKLTPGDFDGDGRSDLALYRQSTGVWYILRSSNNQVRIQQFGISEDKPVQADFDNDGATDLAVYRPSTGVWYASRSSDGGFIAVQFGLSEDIPVVGDYDSDGNADFVVFRPSNRVWYLLKSTEGFSAIQFGLSEDKPLQANFDGDEKRDIAVFRPSNNTWYYLESATGTFRARQFGTNGDTPLPSIYVP